MNTLNLYSPSIATIFPRMQNSVSKNLSKRTSPTSQRVHRQPAAKKLVRSKKKSRPKVQRQNSRTVVKKSNLCAMKKSTCVAKRIITRKNNFPLCQWKFVLRWNSLFHYLFLSKTAATTQPLSQKKIYPNTNLSKLPRTTRTR